MPVPTPISRTRSPGLKAFQERGEAAAARPSCHGVVLFVAVEEGRGAAEGLVGRDGVDGPGVGHLLI